MRKQEGIYLLKKVKKKEVFDRKTFPQKEPLRGGIKINK